MKTGYLGEVRGWLWWSLRRDSKRMKDVGGRWRDESEVGGGRKAGRRVVVLKVGIWVRDPRWDSEVGVWGWGRWGILVVDEVWSLCQKL